MLWKLRSSVCCAGRRVGVPSTRVGNWLIPAACQASFKEPPPIFHVDVSALYLPLPSISPSQYVPRTVDKLSLPSASTEPLCDQRLGVDERVPFAERKAAYHGLSFLREEALKRGALILVINQLRVPVRDLVPKPSSALEGTINRLCSVRIRTEREKTRNEYGSLAYLRVRFNIFRSMVCPPNNKSCGFLFNQRGFSRGFELMRVLLSSNILEQAGSYLRDPDGVSLGPGHIEAAEQIEKNFTKYWRYYNG